MEQVVLPTAESAPTGEKAIEVEDLALDLVRRVWADRSAAQPEDAGSDLDQVILDIQVGDVRCLLLYTAPASRRDAPRLSPRELEIARMVAKGHPNKTIALVLDISTWTVCSHLRRIFVKMQVTSRAAMVARLLEDERLAPDFALRLPNIHR